jgi:8-oxo-dGTP diphosphatase
MLDDLPPRTRLAAYALSLDGRRQVLLVRIAVGYPAAGKWTLPGGGLHFGEHPEAGALRELAEETGLQGEIESFAFVDSAVGPGRPARGHGPWHSLRLIYRVRITGGTLRDEREESSDKAAWHDLRAARDLPLVDLARHALDWLDGRTTGD